MRKLDANTQATLDYLSSLGFRFIDVEVRIGTVEPDIVVYGDEQKESALIVAEVKQHLPPHLELLHPAVQQAFRYSALLGNKAGRLLVSDGENHHWFRLIDGGTSLEYTGPPEPLRSPDNGEVGASPEQILHSAVQNVIASVTGAGMRMELSSGRDILGIIVARLLSPDDRNRTWQHQQDDPREMVERTLQQLLGQRFQSNWTLPRDIVQEAVYLLSEVPRHSLLRTTTARLFWTEILPQLSDQDQAWSSPRPLAGFLVAIAGCKPSDRIVDPACGTGQFLVEADIFRQPEQGLKFFRAPAAPTGTLDLVGYERHPLVAEVARLNFALAGLDGRSIEQDDSLQSRALGKEAGQFDLVISNPPVGRFDQSRRQTSVAGPRLFGSKVETAFVEQAVHLLKPRGRAALLLPEGFFFSRDRREFREWLLQVAKIDAILGLPPGAWTTAKSHTQASVLVFTKQEPQPHRPDYPIFVADLRSLDDQESDSRTPLQSLLDQTLEAFFQFSQEQAHGVQPTGKYPVGNVVSSSLISPERLDVAGIMLEAWRNKPLAAQSRYSVAKLGELAAIILGRHVKKVGERTRVPNSVNYIQAGNVRRFEIELNNVPQLVDEEANAAVPARLKAGDVLITSTGQYLGRAALVTATHIPAVASNAVTILRVRNIESVDPRYLVAFLNSPAGVEQFEQRRIKSVAQPYLRRGDIEDIAIPLPPLEVQKAVVDEIWDLLARADSMVAQAENMRARAQTLLLDVLSERPTV